MAQKTAGSKVGLLIVAVLVLVLVGTVYVKADGGSSSEKISSIQKKYNLFLSPRQEFEVAVDRTAAVSSLYAEYKSDVTSRITLPTGVTETVDNNVNGYLTGTSTGDLMKGEMRISSDLDPSKEVIVEMITSEKTNYIKGPQTQSKWLKIDNSDLEKKDEESPNDASLYGFDILGSIFSEDKALWKAIDKNSIEYQGEDKRNNKTYKKFKVEIGNSEYIKALESNPDASKKSIEEDKKILSSAKLTATFEIDATAKYITKMVIEAKNLKQIVPEQLAAAGISTQHDLKMVVDMSRFNVATDVTIPSDNEILQTDKNVKGVSIGNTTYIQRFMMGQYQQ